MVVSCGCWNRLSPTLSSNNTDLFSHSSGGQEFKIGFTRLPGCRGVEGGAAPAQSPPCGPGPHTLADPKIPGRCLSVCAAPWYGRRNPAEGLAPSLCDGCTAVGLLAPVERTKFLQPTRLASRREQGQLKG